MIADKSAYDPTRIIATGTRSRLRAEITSVAVGPKCVVEDSENDGISEIR